MLVCNVCMCTYIGVQFTYVNEVLSTGSLIYPLDRILRACLVTHDQDVALLSPRPAMSCRMTPLII